MFWGGLGCFGVVLGVSTDGVCAKFNQYKINPACTLCGEEPEDQAHFVLRCRSLSETRNPFTRKIEFILSEYLGHEMQHEICRL